MNGSPKRLFTSIARILSPTKNSSTNTLNATDAHKCASGKYCTTPNQPVGAAHTCHKCKGKIHIWCRGLSEDTEDFCTEICIICSNGKPHP